MHTSQKAKPQRSSASGWGGSGMRYAARVMMTIAPASVDIDRRNMLAMDGGGRGRGNEKGEEVVVQDDAARHLALVRPARLPCASVTL